VPLQPDELFSTWLSRAALLQGCDPIHLTGFIWPQWRAWTVDLDRGLAAERLASLVKRSGNSASELEGATLRPLAALVSPGHDPGAAVWPWVLTLGARNRRRRAGLQYCPECLAQDRSPYFRRVWRLVWHVGCSEHGVLLLDHCTRCQSPVEPHRCVAAHRTLNVCASCEGDLRSGRSKPVCLEALQFQWSADAVLVAGEGRWEGVDLPRQEWFEHAHRAANGYLHARDEDLPLGPRTALPINLQRASERLPRLRMARRVMDSECPGRRIYGLRSQRTVTLGARPARPALAVQGEWMQLLRRLRVGYE
jgi:hypothetical protein